MRLLLRTLVFIAVVSACSDPSARPDFGTYSNNEYTNKFFDLQFEIPKGWVVHQALGAQAIEDQVKNRLDSTNQPLGARLDSVQNVITHLSIFRHKIGSVKEFNPSLILMSEKLPPKGKKINERVYLALTQKQLLSTGQYQIFENDQTRTQIGGEDFFMLRATSRNDSTSITQEFYVRIMEGYALLFILSYDTNTQQKELQELLAGVNF